MEVVHPVEEVTAMAATVAVEMEVDAAAVVSMVVPMEVAMVEVAKEAEAKVLEVSVKEVVVGMVVAAAVARSLEEKTVRFARPCTNEPLSTGWARTRRVLPTSTDGDLS